MLNIVMLYVIFHFLVMLNVIMLNVIMPNVIVLNDNSPGTNMQHIDFTSEHIINELTAESL
jgi:hypothetical protein